MKTVPHPREFESQEDILGTVGVYTTHPQCYSHFQRLYEDQRQNKKGKLKKDSTWKIFSTWCSTRKYCVQSLWETVKCMDKGKNKRMLHKDAFLRTTESVCVHNLLIIPNTLDLKLL